MERKKQERSERQKKPPPPEPEVPPISPSDIYSLLSGMIALFSGVKSWEEVVDITEKCSRFGNDLYNGDLCKSEFFQRFPHASYEAKRKRSSR
jgi:hypothetical protein